MFMRLLIPVLILLFSVSVTASNGFRQFNIGDSTRPVRVAVWYPTDARLASERVADNPAFEGVNVIRNAEPSAGQHPLLLLSHGYGGNWRNQAWLADAMAAQGYIVIAPDHPGTTTQDMTAAHAQQLWQRPQDLKASLDMITANPALAGHIDLNRIAAVGHSLGGWTVMELAGARFDTQQFLRDCLHHAELSSCRLTQKLGIQHALTAAPLAANLRDERIKAFVTLDLGLSRGLTAHSLKQVTSPVLVLTAGEDSPALPARLESHYLADRLESDVVTYKVVSGATHFSFMQLCKPQGEALIEQNAPGEGEICHDGAGVSRRALHKKLANDISRFLNTALHYQP
ncbi:alpha/beta fold hydrolase [Pantoea stewartii subsp. indologenes]|uniref:alpha/beta hydrolase family protein n=1 Tax=Pantoea stewartii TaxID=66269 RepID=UPI00198006D5|nr:alpha/beta fold hydrolase [Pantoea stewartii]MDK2633969.1 alpha/beta fold hydrolase [Pantoea stewartii subsp. indologenes]